MLRGNASTVKRHDSHIRFPAIHGGHLEDSTVDVPTTPFEPSP